MEEGTLAKWLKAEGDAVAPGDVIAEIETDKATMEIEAVDEGTLGTILVAEGTERREGEHVDRAFARRRRGRRDVPSRAGGGNGAEPRRVRPSAPDRPAAPGQPVASRR